MNKTLLSLLTLMASAAAFAQGPGPATAGDAQAERAELLSMFAGPAGLGVVQVGRSGSMVETVIPLSPSYKGFKEELSFPVAGWGEIEKISAPRAESDIEAPDDLRDALGAVPATLPGAANIPPFSLLKAGLPQPVPSGPAGWLVLTRREGTEVRVIKTAEELKRWVGVAELQRRTYEALVQGRAARVAPAPAVQK